MGGSSHTGSRRALLSTFTLLNLEGGVTHAAHFLVQGTSTVDIQTSSPSSTGSFSRLGTPAPNWLDQNKRLVLRLSVAAAALLLAILVISIWASNRKQAAFAAFNSAMDVYDAPIQQPGQRAIPNVKSYSSAAARAQAANPLFRSVAEKYGLFQAGANARYFAGLTEIDMGKTAEAETDLQKVGGSHDDGLAALAKMALAGLYSSSGRAGNAAALYQSLIDHPTLTVSANAARLALASTVESTNPQRARELYAKVKDTDKTTAAGQIATQKLNGK